MKKRRPQPRTEDEERDHWARTDSTRHVDWTRGRRVLLPELKPSLTTISLRLPDLLLAELKLLANRRDVPYQSLLKVFLAERIREELRASGLRQNAPGAPLRGGGNAAPARDRVRDRAPARGSRPEKPARRGKADKTGKP